MNVLQPAIGGGTREETTVVSDFFDISIYIDADAEVIEEWYVTRFLSLKKTAFREPGAYFHRYAELTQAEAVDTARDIWRRINLAILMENIQPTRAGPILFCIKPPTMRLTAYCSEKFETFRQLSGSLKSKFGKNRAQVFFRARAEMLDDLGSSQRTHAPACCRVAPARNPT